MYGIYISYHIYSYIASRIRATVFYCTVPMDRLCFLSRPNVKRKASMCNLSGSIDPVKTQYSYEHLRALRET